MNSDITTGQVQLVKKTWKIFRGMDPSIVGDTFYSKLFTENPSLRRLFPRNMDAQYSKFMEMLNTIVGKLDKTDDLAIDIAAMAMRHAEFGVRPAHYKLAGEALLWTLQQGLGNDWTPAISKAWTDCYAMVADTMIASSSPVNK